MNRRLTKRSTLTIAALALAGGLFASGAHAAVLDLPTGGQVNDDPAAGIAPSSNAGLVDAAGGSARAGGALTPWALFEQATPNGLEIFAREFVNGAWQTRGRSLNLVATQPAEAPSIDFAGAGRNVPWAAWYEPSAALAGGATNIFASRFAAAANTWLPAGQDRSAGQAVPSLNVNTDRVAENPSVAGGATEAGANPEPWVTWQEKDGSNLAAAQRFHIFVSKGVKTAAADCTGFSPGSGPVVNGFCWQMVGQPRTSRSAAVPVTPPTDPSLNVDLRRDGIEPDIAFTGPSDTVPWVVWYETGTPSAGLAANDLVFAAKAVPDPAPITGGFRWTVVGNAGSGLLGPGEPCAVSAAAERACSLNQDPAKSAIDPRVAAGSMAPAVPTAPWVIWAEDLGTGTHGIFVSHLVGDRFVVVNGGLPISPAGVDAVKPDIAFSGNTPYVTWREGAGTVADGHFEGTGANPIFVRDTTLNATLTPAARAPIATLCPATPQTADGATCRPANTGDSFTLFADSSSGTTRLFGRALSPEGVQTGAANSVTATTATLTAAVNPAGTRAKVFFEFGPTPAYGSTTPGTVVGPQASTVSVGEALTGLTPATTINYRVVVQTDLARQVGLNQTFTTAAAPPPPPANVAPRVRTLLAARQTVRRGRVILVPFTVNVNEPGTVRIVVRRGSRVVRVLSVRRAAAGAFRVRLNLGRAKTTGTYTVQVRETDLGGLATTVRRSIRIIVKR